jgi:hypothetical protein
LRLEFSRFFSHLAVLQPVPSVRPESDPVTVPTVPAVIRPNGKKTEKIPGAKEARFRILSFLSSSPHGNWVTFGTPWKLSQLLDSSLSTVIFPPTVRKSTIYHLLCRKEHIPELNFRISPSTNITVVDLPAARARALPAGRSTTVMFVDGEIRKFNSGMCSFLHSKWYIVLPYRWGENYRRERELSNS